MATDTGLVETGKRVRVTVEGSAGAGAATGSELQVTEVDESFWRVSGPGGVLGWVTWVPSRAGFHFRAQRIGRRGPGESLGEYLGLAEAVAALRPGY